MEQETIEKLSEIENIKRTLETPGWEIIEKRFNGLTDDLCDIRNIDKELSLEDRLKQLEIREAAHELVENWINIVKSEAEWAKNTLEVMEDSTSDKIYKTIPSK